VYWGKEDRIMLDVVRDQPDAKVGYTIANFSAALREAGVDRIAAGRGIVVGSAQGIRPCTWTPCFKWPDSLADKDKENNKGLR